MAKHGLVAALLMVLLAGGLAAQPQDQKPPQKPPKAYALIKGTAYGPDNAPFYGARVEVRPAGKRHPSWELMSDHRGEFAQRVPPGPGDYVITGKAEVIDPQTHKTKRLKGEVKVHVEAEEEQNPSLHLSQ
jgi:hypothetical protein